MGIGSFIKGVAKKVATIATGGAYKGGLSSGSSSSSSSGRSSSSSSGRSSGSSGGGSSVWSKAKETAKGVGKNVVTIATAGAYIPGEGKGWGEKAYETVDKKVFGGSLPGGSPKSSSAGSSGSSKKTGGGTSMPSTPTQQYGSPTSQEQARYEKATGGASLTVEQEQFIEQVEPGQTVIVPSDFKNQPGGAQYAEMLEVRGAKLYFAPVSSSELKTEKGQEKFESYSDKIEERENERLEKEAKAKWEKEHPVLTFWGGVNEKMASITTKPAAKGLAWGVSKISGQDVSVSDLGQAFKGGAGKTGDIIAWSVAPGLGVAGKLGSKKAGAIHEGIGDFTGGFIYGAGKGIYEKPATAGVTYIASVGVGAVVAPAVGRAGIAIKGTQFAARHPKLIVGAGKALTYGPGVAYAGVSGVRVVGAGIKGGAFSAGEQAGIIASTEVGPAVAGYKTGTSLYRRWKTGAGKPSYSVRGGVQEVKKGPVTIEEGGASITYEEGYTARSLHVVETKQPRLLRGPKKTQDLVLTETKFLRAGKGKPVTVGTSKSVILGQPRKGVYPVYKSESAFIAKPSSTSPKVSLSIQRGQVVQAGGIKVTPTGISKVALPKGTKPLSSGIKGIGASKELTKLSTSGPGYAMDIPINKPKGTSVIGDISKVIATSASKGKPVSTTTYGAGITLQRMAKQGNITYDFKTPSPTTKLPKGGTTAPAVPATGVQAAIGTAPLRIPSLGPAPTTGGAGVIGVTGTGKAITGKQAQLPRSAFTTPPTRAPRGVTKNISKVRTPTTSAPRISTEINQVQKLTPVSGLRQLQLPRTEERIVPSQVSAPKAIQESMERTLTVPATTPAQAPASTVKPVQVAIPRLTTTTFTTTRTPPPTMVPTRAPPGVPPPPLVFPELGGGYAGRGYNRSWTGRPTKKYHTDVFSALFGIKKEPTVLAKGGVGTGLEMRPFLTIKPVRKLKI